MQLLILFCAIVGALAVRDCPANSHFEECGTACPLTCENYKNPPKFCVLMCKIGCQCDAGYVKAQDGSCVLPEHCPAQASFHQYCIGAPETGMCRGYFPKYYYDIEDGTCKQFIYGGCGGNGNRYDTEEECLNHCAYAPLSRSGSEICDLAIKKGVCKGYFPRFAFDKASGQCKEFIYGGCGGNRNNFQTVEECEITCRAEEVCKLPLDSGACKSSFPKWGYEPSTGSCKQFVYGGCGGNLNRFNTKDECEIKCSKDVCKLPMDSGACKAHFPKWGYDKSTGSCKQFVYGGCGGNGNRFDTKEECDTECTL